MGATKDTPVLPVDPDKLVAALSSDPSRRLMAACVAEGRSARDLERLTALPHSTVYRLLGQLVADHLLVVERSALTEDGKRYEIYRSRVRTSRVEFDSTGTRVTWEGMDEADERTARLWRLV